MSQIKPPVMSALEEMIPNAEVKRFLTMSRVWLNSLPLGMISIGSAVTPA